MPKPRVLIAILTQGWTRMELTLRIPMLAYNPAYECVLTGINDRPIEQARNKLALQTKQGDFDWLLMIDADNPPIRNPVELVALDKDVVVCPTPMVRPLGNGKAGIFWNVMEPTGRPAPDSYTAPPFATRHGLERLDDRGAAAGTGCILIRRAVFDKLRAPFMRQWDEDGLVLQGSDVTFCEKAAALGFEVWAHFDYPCLHWCGNLELSAISNVDYSDVLPTAPPIL